MSIFERVVLEQVGKATSGRAAVFVVKLDGREIGLLEKYRDTRSDKQPWKAFAGIGVAARYLGAWYGGAAGRIMARNAVLQADKEGSPRTPDDYYFNQEMWG